MPEPFATWFPNVANYWDIFLQALDATFQMFFIAGAFTLLIGGAFGILLTTSKVDGIKPNKVIHFVLEVVTNIFRAVPFIILLIFLIPFTRMLVGTSIGVKGAVVPLIFGAVPFFTRQVETVLAEVDPGKIEAARASICTRQCRI